MEDLSTFVWLAIGVLWFLARIFRRGVKKVREAQQDRPRQSSSRPAVASTEIPQARADGRSGSPLRGDTSPPPIVPR